MISIIHSLLFNCIYIFFWCKSPSAKRTKARQSFSHHKNHWLLTFIYGLLGGILITTLVIIVFNCLPKSHTFFHANKNLHNSTKEIKTKPKPTNTNIRTANNYDFYNLLTNGQVSDIKDSNKLSINNKINTSKHQCLLHLGSFKTLDEADGLKAKLVLQGFEANLEKIYSSNKKEVTYQIILGPFSSQSIAEIKKQQLDLAGFKNISILKK